MQEIPADVTLQQYCVVMKGAIQLECSLSDLWRANSILKEVVKLNEINFHFALTGSFLLRLRLVAQNVLH